MSLLPSFAGPHPCTRQPDSPPTTVGSSVGSSLSYRGPEVRAAPCTLHLAPAPAHLQSSLVNQSINLTASNRSFPPPPDRRRRTHSHTHIRPLNWNPPAPEPCAPVPFPTDNPHNLVPDLTVSTFPTQHGRSRRPRLPLLAVSRHDSLSPGFSLPFVVRPRTPSLRGACLVCVPAARSTCPSRPLVWPRSQSRP